MVLWQLHLTSERTDFLVRLLSGVKVFLRTQVLHEPLVESKGKSFQYYLNDVMFTSWDSPGALACRAGNTVSASEFHVWELRHISTAFGILTRHAVVLRARGVALIMACLLGQVGRCLPHDHTWPSGEISFHSDLQYTWQRNNLLTILHPN